MNSVHELKQENEVLRQRLSALEEQNGASTLSRLRRAYTILSQINQTAARVHERQELFESICQLALRVGEFRLAWVGLWEPGSGALICVAEQGGGEAGLPVAALNTREELFRDDLPARALRSGQVEFSHDLQADPGLVHWRSTAVRLGIHSAAAIPFRQQGQLIGVFTLYAAEPNSFACADEQQLLQDIHMELSLALDKLAAEVERQQVETRLRESESSLRKSQALAHVGNWDWDVQTNRVSWSEEMHRIFGLDPQHFNGDLQEVISRTIHPADREKVLRANLAASQTSQPAALEYRVIWPDGSEHTVWAQPGEKMTDETGKLLRLSGIVQDITERKRTEDTLRALEERHHTILVSLIDNVVTLDEDMRIRYINHVSPGLTEEEVLNSAWQDWLSVEDQPRALEIIRGILDAGGLGEIEFRAVGPQRQLTWFHVMASRFWEAGAKRIVLIARDITERKQAEQDLHLSEEKYRLLAQELEQRVVERTAEVQDLYDNAPTGYHSLDAAGCFVQVNQTELNWIGYTHPEIIGQPLIRFITAESQREFQKQFPVLKQQGWIKDIELDIIRRDGSTFPVLASATAIYGKDGAYLMSRSTLFDNTERKKIEMSLRQSRDELARAYAIAEKALHAKDEFLANISHELRTPLNGILGLSEILLTERRGALNVHQLKYVRGIETSGRYLLSLINDILDLSKTNAGLLEIHPKSVLVAEICQSSLGLVKEQAWKKGLRLDYTSDVAVTRLWADPLRLKQILVNLLSNAIKFTPPLGSILLETHANQERDCVEFRVTDTGIGISPEDLPRLFQPFTQLNSSLTRQYEGTGLGLVLVKQLAEMHGGSVSVTSQPDHGSCFSVFLPWKSALAAHQADDQSTAYSLASDASVENNQHLTKKDPDSPVTLLLAEDSEVNTLIISDYLGSQGYKVVVAQTGLEALRQAEAIFPALILMDIQMPEMNGIEAIQRLRANPRLAATPIVALTAMAMTGDRERCLAAGANEYVSKPIQLNLLGQIIHRLLHDH
jgi:PAS domain S-box-containing protein